MSLFDILRYPISDSPTATELSALPTNLFEDWRSNTGWQEHGNYKTPVLIGDWYSSRDLTLSFYKIERLEINLLKEMIKEYDELICCN